MKGSSMSAGPIANAWLPTVVGYLTAIGTNQATAYAIPLGQDLSVFTSVAASTGAVLPSSGIGIGESYEVANHGASALLVYPPLGGQIGTLGLNIPYSVTSGKLAFFKCVANKVFASCP